MQVNRLVVGDLETNCYILINNNKCLIIDPGDEYEKIKNEVSNKEVVGVIITHHHFDHIGALNYFNKSLILDKSNLEELEKKKAEACGKNFDEKNIDPPTFVDFRMFSNADWLNGGKIIRE